MDTCPCRDDRGTVTPSGSNRAFLPRTTVRARTQAWHQRWHAVGRCLLVSCALFCAPSALASELLVLDFDLNDLTLMPQEQEIERAAELGPMLAETLDAAHGHTIIELPERAAAEAAKGKGYLYDKPALIADIGRQSKGPLGDLRSPAQGKLPVRLPDGTGRRLSAMVGSPPISSSRSRGSRTSSRPGASRRSPCRSTRALAELDTREDG